MAYSRYLLGKHLSTISVMLSHSYNVMACNNYFAGYKLYNKLLFYNNFL